MHIYDVIVLDIRSSEVVAVLLEFSIRACKYILVFGVLHGMFRQRKSYKFIQLSCRGLS